MFAELVDVLFPRRCLGCGAGGWPFCGACLASVAVLYGPGCRTCGRPLEVTVERCPDCPPGDVGWARSAYLYEGPVRRALFRLKFSGVRSVAAALAPVMIWALTSGPEPPAGMPPDEPPWTITWVPLGRRRKRTRGYDQAEALARAVGSRAGWPVQRLLARRVETAPQARRSGADRRRALHGAFRVIARPPPRILLVDDVLTSGATVAECANVLRQAGALDVGVLTAARSLGNGVPGRCYNAQGLPPGSVVAREIASR